MEAWGGGSRNEGHRGKLTRDPTRNLPWPTAPSRSSCSGTATSSRTADYACIREALVPHGYSVAFPDRLSASPAIGIDAYARDLLFVAAAMRALAGDPASRYFGRIAEGTALLGPRGSTLGSELQNALTVAYLLPWLVCHLHGDVDAWGEFGCLLDGDPCTSFERRP